MRLIVLSHKRCWRTDSSPSGYATDGGFPFQMSALSELFDETILMIPCSRGLCAEGTLPLTGHNLKVTPLTEPQGRGLARKLRLPFWFLRNGWKIASGVWKSEAVHAPIPGDIGTIGMLLAFILRKPLFVRHCGNWLVPRTAAERFWKWFMERFAGGKRVMLATGGAPGPPSSRNPAIQWIFSTTLTERELNSGCRRRLPSDGLIRLIIACRQDKEKGGAVVIESLPQVAESFPEVHLDVVGDGNALEDLKLQARSLGVEHRVRFHDRVEPKAVLRLLRRAHLFCYPTAASEGFPKVVLEALASGLPVITTPVSVLPQLITGDCGTVLSERTPAAVARAVIEILSDPERYEHMSRSAVEAARAYSLECWRDTIGDLLRSSWQPIHSDV
jgi:Glycosyl transferases group 1